MPLFRPPRNRPQTAARESKGKPRLKLGTRGRGSMVGALVTQAPDTGNMVDARLTQAASLTGCLAAWLFRLCQHSVGASKGQLPIPVFRIAHLSRTLFSLLCFCQILSRFCFHCSFCPFPNGPHRREVISLYSKIKSPTSG